MWRDILCKWNRPAIDNKACYLLLSLRSFASKGCGESRATRSRRESDDEMLPLAPCTVYSSQLYLPTCRAHIETALRLDAKLLFVNLSPFLSSELLVRSLLLLFPYPRLSNISRLALLSANAALRRTWTRCAAEICNQPAKRFVWRALPIKQMWLKSMAASGQALHIMKSAVWLASTRFQKMWRMRMRMALLQGNSCSLSLSLRRVETGSPAALDEGEF